MEAINLAFAPHVRISPEWSRIFADQLFGFVVAVLAIGAFLYALWAWSRANQLGQEVWKRRGLRPGPLLLPGIAQPLDDEHVGARQALIELTIRQQGKQFHGKYGPNVRWTEISRELVDRPFALRTDAGEEVRVEPNGCIELIDTLEKASTQFGGMRSRVARIIPGERIWVRGVLSSADTSGPGPYRGAGTSQPTLRPPRGGSLIVSSEPVDNEHRALARFHFLFALLFAAGLAICQGVLFRPYHALRAGSEVAEAVVTEHRQWVTRSKSTTTQHYGFRLEFECPTGRAVVDEETNGRAFVAVQDGETVPVSFVPRDPTIAQIGRNDEIGTTQVRVTFAMVGLLMLVMAWIIIGVARRPWWRRRTLVENEKGTL